MAKSRLKKYRIGHRVCALLVCFFLCVSCVGSWCVAVAPAKTVEAAGKKVDKLLTLSAARRLAIAKSEKIEGLDIKIESKAAAVQSAIKSLQEKERNMGTFRWSPLLSFKFPQKPNEAQAFEFQFKPQQLRNQQQILHHKVRDTELEITEKVSNTYIDISSANQELTYNTLREKKLAESLDKILKRREEGSVTMAAVEVVEKRHDTAAKAKTKSETKLLRAKQKLGKLIGLDITTGYRFSNEFVFANMTRDDIPYLQQKALDEDQNIFESKIARDEALLALKTNHALIQKKYSRDYWMISSYIEGAEGGSKIQKKPFKKRYDEFVKQIDSDWQGSYRILFISFPKEWLKGSLDGVRYIEDDPYVLYTAALDYESARKDFDNTSEDLRNTVYDMYDNYVETKKAYESARDEYYRQRRQITVDEVKNLMGQLSNEEFETEYSEYENAQNDMNEALRTYSESLFNFDRTTCGGVSDFFGGDTKGKGVNIRPVVQEGITYNFKPVADSSEFLLSLNVPDDFEAKTGLSVNAFQLRCNGRNIGAKTNVGQSMRHVALSVTNVTEAFIRIFDGDTVLDDCVIDPLVARGPLTLTTGYDTKSLRVIGTYSSESKLGTDTVEISVQFDQAQVGREYVSGEACATYTIATESGSVLGSGDKTPQDQPFTYLGLISGDIGKLILHMYDKDGEEIGIAKFDTKTKSIYHDVDDLEAERIAEEKKRRSEIQEQEEQTEAEQRQEDQELEAAKKLLERLGVPETPENIAYARAHYRELSYGADLKENIDKLQGNIDSVQKKIDAARAAGQDTKALEARLETLRKQKAVVEKTLSGMESYQKLVVSTQKNREEISRLQKVIEADQKYIAEGEQKLRGEIEALNQKYNTLRNSLAVKRQAKPKVSAGEIQSLERSLLALERSRRTKEWELRRNSTEVSRKKQEIADSIRKLKELGADTSRYE